MNASLDLDLDVCAREPIRTPGGIQPQGAIMVVDPATLDLLNASANLAEVTGMDPALGGPLLPSGLAAELLAWGAAEEPVYLRTHVIHGRRQQVSAHRARQGVILEFEEPPDAPEETLEAVYPRIGALMEALRGTASIETIAAAAVKEIRALTGFNRALFYGFDARWNGRVLAEDGDGALPSYLGLRFPASDIPAQARELYTLNRLRLIADADYSPTPLVPALSPVDGMPVDLSQAALRSVSPIHLQYMRNMGTLASMSISVLVDEELYGLVTCHNATPRRVTAQIRTACDLIGQILSLQIGARVRGERARERVERKNTEARLLARLSAAPRYQDALGAAAEDWLGLVDADGACLATPEGLVTVGQAPSPPELEALVDWLRTRGVAEIFATDSLKEEWPPADAFSGPASGLLAVPISTIHAGYILWFRQEEVRTVSWGGDPRRPADAHARLTPRQSFETWKELKRGSSRPWSEAAQETARDFRRGVVDIVLGRAEERAELSDRLQRTNEELEAFSYSVSHDLRAPFRHIVGYAELLSNRERGLDETSAHYLRSIVEAAMAAGRLVDDLLNFSQVGRARMSLTRVDMAKLLDEVRRTAEPEVRGRRVEWRIGALPPAAGDGALIRQALANLVDNALKYARDRDPAIIEIYGLETADGPVYTITDNGVGFDQTYVNKLFGVFQRLHRADEFPGTGIGLALVKRIIERHGGTVSATGTIGEGASFSFSLPSAAPTVEPYGQP